MGILHKKYHKTQTRFIILNWFHLAKKFNVISSVNQKSYKFSFVRVFIKHILLYVIGLRLE